MSNFLCRSFKRQEDKIGAIIIIMNFFIGIKKKRPLSKFRTLTKVSCILNERLDKLEFKINPEPSSLELNFTTYPSFLPDSPFFFPLLL